jgi:hypothetical protein
MQVMKYEVVFLSVKKKMVAKRGSIYCCRLKDNASFFYLFFNIRVEVVHQLEKLLSFMVHSQRQYNLI